MKTVCEYNQCTGCQSCVNICTQKAITIEDTLLAYNAVIDESKCVQCGQCEKLCAVNNPLEGREPITWAQGWALDQEIRKRASSGGVATALQIGFVDAGGVVCSCLFRDGKFVFDFATTKEDVLRFSGSKYVKSNPGKVYPEIKKLLQEQKKVLFIGLPCQCAAVKKYTKNHSLLYTVDLICHGTPSPKHLEKFLTEKKVRITEVPSVEFREKMNYRIAIGGKSVEAGGVRDRYTMAFLKGVSFTENCYACQYANTLRVSDITLGDSWGSLLAQEEQEKGISLVLCQTEKGKELLEGANVHLEGVDVLRAVQYNKQLNHPSVKAKEYDMFYRLLDRKKSFSKSIWGCYPKECFRRKIKGLLIKCGLLRNAEKPRG